MPSEKEELERIAADVKECHTCCENAIDNIVSIPFSYVTIKDAISMLEKDRKNLDGLKERISIIDAELQKYINPSEGKTFFLSYLIPTLSTMYEWTLKLLKTQDGIGNGDKKCIDVFYFREPTCTRYLV